MNDQMLAMLGRLAGPRVAETFIRGAVAYYKANPEEARRLRDFILGSIEAVTAATPTQVDDLLVWAFRELMEIPASGAGEREPA